MLIYLWAYRQNQTREKFSRLRQSLLHLVNEMKGLVEPFFSDRPVIKGTVYELKRRCGKPGCKCAQGELHARMVVSASEEREDAITGDPTWISRGSPSRRCRRYQELRRVRARLVEIHRQMLKVMDEMEAMRREELSCF